MGIPLYEPTPTNSTPIQIKRKSTPSSHISARPYLPTRRSAVVVQTGLVPWDQLVQSRLQYLHLQPPGGSQAPLQPHRLPHLHSQTPSQSSQTQIHTQGQRHGQGQYQTQDERYASYIQSLNFRRRLQSRLGDASPRTLSTRMRSQVASAPYFPNLYHILSPDLAMSNTQPDAGTTQSDHVAMEQDGMQIDTLDRTEDTETVAMQEQTSGRVSVPFDGIDETGDIEGNAEGDDDGAMSDEDMQRLLAWARFFSQFERLNEVNNERLERLVQQTRRESQ